IFIMLSEEFYSATFGENYPAVDTTPKLRPIFPTAECSHTAQNHHFHPRPHRSLFAKLTASHE
ncbi:MAG: hypothetical protein NTZ39_04310, partial [Methanoregula sp.]|nr:hypothetical protein [Methanoregula sp.]